jgi:glutathione S-transferase
MKPFYAAGSPHARIIRVVLRETRLDRRVPEQEVTLREPNSGLLPFNPGGKVPTLQLDEGAILNESLLVLSYLDTQHDGRKLLPMDGSDGWRTLADTGRAIAFLDGINAWNRELRFGLKAPGTIAIEITRAERVADALERALGEGRYQGAPDGSVDAAQIVPGRRSKTPRAATKCGRGSPAGRSCRRFSTRSRGGHPLPPPYSRKSSCRAPRYSLVTMSI